MKQKTISVHELHGKMQQGAAEIWDVREYSEFVGGHIAGARLLPLGQISEQEAPVGEVYLICRSGRRAQCAAATLEKAAPKKPTTEGFSPCCPVVVEGGMEAWRGAGLPVQSEKGPISLERQVRVVAGLLVLLGLLVPRLRGVSYIVGGGLVFAGVTDLCGIALLLAKLPWNRRKS